MKPLFLLIVFAFAFNTKTYSQIENKTVCIKHPSADNLENFLKNNSSVFFEFKADKLQAENFIENIKKSPSVKSCNKGKITGDFHGIQVIFNNPPSEPDFLGILKKAGAEYIKINNSEPQKL